MSEREREGGGGGGGREEEEPRARTPCTTAGKLLHAHSLPPEERLQAEEEEAEEDAAAMRRLVHNQVAGIVHNLAHLSCVGGVLWRFDLRCEPQGTQLAAFILRKHRELSQLALACFERGQRHGDTDTSGFVARGVVYNTVQRMQRTGVW